MDAATIPARWTDTSEFQGSALTSAYQHRVASFRCMDGTTYHDKKFAANLAYAQSAYAAGEMDFYIVYFVYRTNGAQALYNAWTAALGSIQPGMVLMIDVESWSGAISGNHSSDLNTLFGLLSGWAGSFDRVIGYANKGDMAGLWPQRDSRCRCLIASYGSSWTYSAVSGAIGQQYTNGVYAGPSGYHNSCAPFGACDHNATPNYTSAQLATLLGVTATSEDDDEMKFRLIKDTSDTTGAIYAYNNGGMWWHVPDPNWEAILLNNPDCLSTAADITKDTATFDALKAMADSAVNGPLNDQVTDQAFLNQILAAVQKIPTTGGSGGGASTADIVAAMTTVIQQQLAALKGAVTSTVTSQIALAGASS